MAIDRFLRKLINQSFETFWNILQKQLIHNSNSAWEWNNSRISVFFFFNAHCETCDSKLQQMCICGNKTFFLWTNALNYGSSSLSCKAVYWCSNEISINPLFSCANISKNALMVSFWSSTWTIWTWFMVLLLEF